MTKKPVDYSKACIYKIVCRDPEIKDCYVGSTTNLIKRRAAHKYNCNYVNGKVYNYYVYQFIRENGGFDNWQVIEIEPFECKTKEELHRRERYYLEKLGATLNKVIPTRTNKEYFKQYREYNKEYFKQYREYNKETIKIIKKKWYQDNKKIINEMNKQKMNCACGSVVRKSDKSTHEKSKKHIKYMQTINI